MQHLVVNYGNAKFIWYYLLYWINVIFQADLKYVIHFKRKLCIITKKVLSTTLSNDLFVMNYSGNRHTMSLLLIHLIILLVPVFWLQHLVREGGVCRMHDKISNAYWDEAAEPRLGGGVGNEATHTGIDFKKIRKKKSKQKPFNLIETV